MASWIESLTTVDVNKKFVDLGKQHFGFQDSDGIESVISDAHDFVKAAKPETYDIIFMDVCFEAVDQEGISPPKHFLAPEFIKSLLNALTKDGVCAINTLIKNDEAKKAIFK